MSGSLKASSTPQRLPKTMSSRLSNMKFMQRTPSNASQPSSPATDSEPPSAKRTKVAHSGLAQQTGASDASLGDELRPLGANTTETMWTMPAAKGTQTTQLDAESSDDELPPWQVGPSSKGRMTFGKIPEKAKPTKPQSDEDDEGDESDDAETSEGEGESVGAKKFAEQNLARVRAAIAEKKQTERGRSSQFSRDRKKKNVRLNKTDGGRISKSGGGGGISSGGR